uniref:Complement C8 alpha chain n=1 Tax=Leptobrachium leishanense TaxID=445787 RepID=A0A8C5WK98_9ANUR
MIHNFFFSFAKIVPDCQCVQLHPRAQQGNMGAFKDIFILVLCTLHFNLLLAAGTGHENAGRPLSYRRRGRDASSASPVDCRLNQWSGWSPCFPCQERKYRFRNLEQPAKYSGRICVGSLLDTVSCKTSDKCVPENICGSDFQCQETGRCIKQRLVCNGEPDCLDESDEKDCDVPEDEAFCKQLLPIPGAERAVRGFNILTNEYAQNIYDHRYYGGQCEYIYNGEWRKLKYDPTCEQMSYADDEKYYRKPYNFHVYQFLARADTGLAFEVYEDSSDLLNAQKRGGSSSFGFTFTIKPAESPAGLEVGKHSRFSFEHLKNVTTYNAKNLRFMRILTKVQTARFKMRRNNIVIDEDFQQALMELPDTYNYGLYSKFIHDYGTHLITSGIMGGTMENILVLDHEIMKRQEIEYSTVSRCIGHHLGIAFESDDGQLQGNLQIKSEKCEVFNQYASDSTKHDSLIKDVITIIDGGDTASAGGLLHIFDVNTYRFWGRSLKYNPAVIDYEVQPIYEALRQTGLSGIETKLKNLKTAYDAFLSEFNACRCGPCQNNGVPILNNNECSCLCKSGYSGPSCEETLRTGTKADGSWSCWTSWSNCQYRQRQRTRACNNPSPKNGGMRCAGKDVQKETC